MDNVRAVNCGEVDLALSTPAGFVRMALDGIGPYQGEPLPRLRALGTIAQRDRLVTAVAGEHGIKSFADWREARAGLRVATGPDDGVSHVGLAASQVLARHGISPGQLERWGGSLIVADRPELCLRLLRDGKADAIVNEAVMTPGWTAAAEERSLAFLPMESAVLDDLEQAFGWRGASVSAGYWPGLDRDLPTLDFSDFLLLATEDLPDDVAYLITWCLVETRHALERQYRHLPPDRSPVGYPLDPAAMGRTAIPLHPASARYFSARLSEGPAA